MKKSILVLDDSADVRMLLRAGLEFDEHRVFTASNGREALELIRREIPQLLLLDVQMPGQSGPEFLTELEATLPAERSQMKVVYLTAGEAPRDDRVNGSISKMVGIEELAQAVERFLQGEGSESLPLA